MKVILTWQIIWLALKNFPKNDNFIGKKNAVQIAL